MVVDEHSMRCLPNTICLGLPFALLRLCSPRSIRSVGFVPNQFEPVATVAINRHSKQSLTYEVDQGADTKIDRQQDA